MKKHLIVSALCAFLAFMPLQNAIAAGEGAPGISKLITSSQKIGSSTVSVLFIGNSYTYYNDMPQMVADIAAGDMGNSVIYQIQSATRGGKSLTALLQDQDIVNLVSARLWNYVVLQEQSFWAMAPESVEVTANAARDWVGKIKAEGAKPLLYVTWARQPNSYWYTDRQFGFTKSPHYMQGQLDQSSAVLGQQLGMVTVPVGDAFATALQQDEKWPLYAEDSSHPSRLGSYLAALVFYKTISGRSPESTTYAPADMDASSAAALRKIAASMPVK
ncbi:MAG: hypothetical protein PW788_09305 [Micavibrio sp.]|nr:hypothetical protein [Micavibrio sp.]